MTRTIKRLSFATPEEMVHFPVLIDYSGNKAFERRLSVVMSELKERCDNLNEFLANGALRRFQHDIWRFGRFEISLSPWSANLRFERSIGVKRNEHWFGARVPNSHKELWFLTGSFAEGFPIVAVVLWSERKLRLVQLGKQKTAAISILRIKANRFLATRRRIQFDWTQNVQPELVIGHMNFAHLAWNELPALDAIAPLFKHSEIRCKKILTEWEPLLPISELFPEIPQSLFQKSSEKSNFERHNALTFRVGSSLLSASVKEKIQDKSQQLSLPPDVNKIVRKLSAPSRSVIWITVRLKNRTAVNQVEMLVATLNHLGKRFGNATFVLNGFALPEYANCDDQLKETFAPLIRKLSDFCASVVEKIPESALRDRVIPVNGLSVLQTIRLAGLADFYIAHPGTIQHIVGWFWRKPGVILEPINGKRIANWYCRNVEDSLEPYVLPSSFFNVLPVADGELARNACYEFKDISALTQELENLAQKHLKYAGRG